VSVLVTGASGFIGSHLVQALLERHRAVVALSRRPATVNHPRLRWIEGDFTRPDVLDSLPDDLDALVHLATAGIRVHRSAGGTIDPDAVAEISRVNVAGTVAVLNFAHGRSIARVVFASSMAVYRRPVGRLPVREEDDCYPVGADVSYASSKLAGELFCQEFGRAFGLPSVILRIAFVYGAGMGADRVIPIFLDRARRGEPLRINGSGEESWDFIYVDDAVSGIVRALETSATGVINLGSGEETTLNRLARCVLEAVGRPGGRIEHGPAGEHEAHRFCMDIGRARDVLGYVPAWSLPRGIAALTQAG
jgi:UDP-glucose 4-epimerase